MPPDHRLPVDFRLQQYSYPIVSEGMKWKLTTLTL